MQNKKVGLILVGGKGTRLWPVSRENYPKQFVEFKDGLSLFQLTIRRSLTCFAADNLYTVTGEAYKFTICNQIDHMPKLSLKEKAALKNNIVIEPCGKNTAPALMLGLKFLENKNKNSDNDIVYVFPSDHIIEPESGLKKLLNDAYSIAQKDKIVVFGIKPTSPHQGYGYINIADSFGKGFIVEKFVEKPSFEGAMALIEKGAFWNAGIFAFKKSVFLNELKQYKPEIAKFYDLKYDELVKKFSTIPADSIDYAVMQKTDKAAVVEFTLRWSDLGSWDSFLDFYHKGDANFSIGKSEFISSKGCFAYSNDRLVTLIGMEDAMVIDSDDALLVVKKGFSNDVKALTEALNKTNPHIVKDSTTVYRPWGFYTILKESEGFKVKKIGVYPGKSLSLQNHKYRSEHWNVVEGNPSVIIGNKNHKLKRNQSIFVPKGVKHKLQNPTKKMVRIIEVQIGNYLGEDDIKRFDSYHHK